MDKQTQYLAERMFGGPVPKALASRLSRVETLVKSVAAQEISRQIVGCIIEAYERETAAEERRRALARKEKREWDSKKS